MRLPTATAVLFGLTLFAASGSATADGDQTLVCAFESRVALDPGETFSAASGTYAGEGIATCAGRLDGETVDGSGTISYEGEGGTSGPIADTFGGDTCVMGSGTGSVSLDIESTEGTPLTLEADYELIRLGVIGTATGEQLLATFQFIPDTDADCIYNPIVQATVYGQALFTDVA